MGRLVFSQAINNVDPGSYALALTLKDSAGAVVGQGADVPVTVVDAPDVPVFEEPDVEVTG